MLPANYTDNEEFFNIKHQNNTRYPIFGRWDRREGIDMRGRWDGEGGGIGEGGKTGE